MICTGQRSAACCAQQQRQSGTTPSARSPLNLYCSTICENESHGFWSKSSGLVFQQAPQLTQVMRSIITFIWLVPRVLVYTLSDGIIKGTNTAVLWPKLNLRPSISLVSGIFYFSVWVQYAMREPECQENYPIGIIVGSNLLSFLIYGVGACILYLLVQN